MALDTGVGATPPNLPTTPTAGLGTDGALELLLKAAQAKANVLKKQIETAKKGTTSKNKAQAAAAKAQLAKLTNNLGIVQKDIIAKQNKIYEAKGEYDKLLTGENRDAYMAVTALFKQFGLESLSGKIYDFVKNGYSPDTISILLQDTPEYKKRFAANEARKKAGINVLSPAEYLSIEQSYRQIFNQSGLPQGFYDTNDDFTNFISGDMSPTELKARVDAATQATILANPQYKQALAQMGLSQGDLTAYFLDPKKALPYIQKAAATAQIGAEALQRGFAFDQQYAENLATQGVTSEQAAQGYAQIGDEFSSLQTLGAVYGGGWTQREAEESTFTGGGAEGKKREALISKEKGAFSGSAGGARQGLAGRGGAR